jgi:hypothetical protein
MAKSKSTSSATVAIPSRAKSNENKPIHRIKYGAVKATIWQNDSAKGPFYTVTVSRSWRDDKQEWHDNASFHFKDLPNLAKAITDSHSWIDWQERQKTSKAPQKGGVQ